MYLRPGFTGRPVCL